MLNLAISIRTHKPSFQCKPKPTRNTGAFIDGKPGDDPHSVVGVSEAVRGVLTMLTIAGTKELLPVGAIALPIQETSRISSSVY
jgi:hypothetical protein